MSDFGDELERVLAGEYDGTALAQFLEEQMGDTGHTIGLLFNAFALTAGFLVLLNFLFTSLQSSAVPMFVVAGLTVLTGIYAALETAVDALTGEDIGSEAGTLHFSISVIVFTIFTGFILRSLWMHLSPTSSGTATFFAAAVLLFSLWARADF